jgi:hypothetical protein
MEQQDKCTKYLQFPLYLMQNFFTDPIGTINKIIDAGVFYMSNKIPIMPPKTFEKIFGPGKENEPIKISGKNFTRKELSDNTKAATQVLYDYYRHKDRLTPYLEDELDRHSKSGALCLDEDYCGFGGKDDPSFSPIEESNDLSGIMLTDDKLKRSVLEYYRVHSVLRILGIETNTGRSVMTGWEILQATPPGEPWPMVNVDILFDYLNNNKTQFDHAQLAAYLAIRSVIGKRSRAKTNEDMILARMLGYKTFQHLRDAELDPASNAIREKYCTRWWMNKVLGRLQTDWRILIHSFKGSHGLYVGIESKISMDSFILAVETGRHTRKLAALKQQKDAAREKALQHFNKEQQFK